MLIAGSLLIALGLTGAQPSTATIEAVVFCDENGNGRLDPDERLRIPNVVVEIAGRNGRSRAAGQLTIEGVPVGRHDVSVRSSSLPPFYSAAPLRVSVPCAEPLAIPVRLDAGVNRPYVYLAVGDSITEGVGSSDDAGYHGRLQARLCAHFGDALLVNAGSSGRDSHAGARRIEAALRVAPAYTLILYGTNDWDDELPRDTVTLNSLRRIVRHAKAAHSLPFLATVIPTNVGADARASAARNRWVAALDVAIRRLAQAEGATLVDLEAAFRARPDTARLFHDGLHPNDEGYEVIAETFFAAITQRAGLAFTDTGAATARSTSHRPPKP